MTKLLVLYDSMYGHIETMAGAVAEGAKSVAGNEVTTRRVPELLSENELAIARFQGAHVAAVAKRQAAGRPGLDAALINRGSSMKEEAR